MKSNARRHARGVTLVELLVALLLALLLVGAAAYLYLSTRESQRAIDETGGLNDVGGFVMQKIGRDLMSAGFFPAGWSEDGQFALASYASYVEQADSGTHLAQGIYGCDGGRIDLDDGTCKDNADGSDADSIVTAYFTLDPDAVGSRRDCGGADAAKDSARNAPDRVWGTESAPSDENTPLVAPAMVVNSYYLGQTAALADRRTVQVGSLFCEGNGAANGVNLAAGVEDLQIWYGVTGTSADALSPEQFLQASDMSADMWGRVVAVRVCVQVASQLGGTALAATQTGRRSYIGCDSEVVTQAAGDTTIRKTFVQTFGLRNRQTATY